MEILVPAPLEIPACTKLDLLSRAVAARPDAAGPRLQLAALLLGRDLFDEAVEALRPAGTASTAEHALLIAQVMLSRRQPGDAVQAAQAAHFAASLTDEPGLRSEAQLAEARALLQLRRDDQGIALLYRVLQDNPGQLGAFRTLTDRLLRDGETAAVLELTDDLRAAGLNNARVIGAQAVAKARSGAISEARVLAGIDRSVATFELAVPTGWSNLAEFNQTLRAEAEADPDLRQGRHGTASRATWRVDHPQRAVAPAFRALHQAIAATVSHHIAALPAAGHPWLAARPERLAMRSWCVMTDGDGFEEWHTHPAGWMSGGYYIAVPEVDEAGDQKPGSLAFGMPPLLAGEEAAAAFGEVLVPPYAGMLALFPSHLYHRTYPHGRAGRRICLAFDLVPA